MEFNKEFWDERYSKAEIAWDAGIITTPLKEYIDQLTDKSIKILIPGCGNAHEAHYLHDKGFTNVYIIDIADKPLHDFLMKRPAFHKKHLLLGDFFDLKGEFDLIIEQTFFCSMMPEKRHEYARCTNDLLKTGGKLVGLLFQIPLNSDHPPFGGTKEDYIRYFEPYFEFNTFEEAYNSIKPRRGSELFINLSKKG